MSIEVGYRMRFHDCYDIFLFPLATMCCSSNVSLLLVGHCVGSFVRFACIVDLASDTYRGVEVIVLHMAKSSK